MMETLWIKLFLLSFVASVVNSGRQRYDGYKVLQTNPLNSVKVIEDLVRFVLDSGPGAFDFWVNPGVGRRAKIMAHPEHVSSLGDFLNGVSVGFRVLIEDVQRSLKSEAKFLRKRKLKKPSGGATIDWKAYYGTKDIYKFMHQMEGRHKSFVSVVDYGKSYENRNLKVLRIMKAGENASSIFVEGGMHAREWISPSMVTYLIQSLLSNPSSSSLLSEFNFHFIPLANPDGYEYSRRTNRLWRKTRAHTLPGSPCRGVDGNRNWGFKWGGKGVSLDPCSPNYLGSSSFSEPETNGIRKYLEGLEEAPILSLSLHSAARLLLVPFGFSNSAYPHNYIELVDLAREAVDSLNSVHNSNFKAIHSANLYPASGASDDWYIGALGSRFAYTFELRQGGRYGFDLPLDEIIPSGEELWAAFKTFLKRISEIKKEDQRTSSSKDESFPPPAFY